MTALQWVIYVAVFGTGAFAVVATARAKRDRLQRSREWAAAGDYAQAAARPVARRSAQLNWAAEVIGHGVRQRVFNSRGKCSVCGRPLTDPESVQRGCGPKCAGTRRARTRHLAAGPRY